MQHDVDYSVCKDDRKFKNKADRKMVKECDKEFIKNLDYSEIEFPVAVKQYNKIEKQNNININVFGYEDKQPYPIYVSKEKFEHNMNILLITEGGKKHYVLEL